MNNRTNYTGNVVPIRAGVRSIDHRRASPFDELTAALVMERHRRGELEPALLAVLLAGVGLQVPR
jgi:hypothetical protein